MGIAKQIPKQLIQTNENMKGTLKNVKLMRRDQNLYRPP